MTTRDHDSNGGGGPTSGDQASANVSPCRGGLLLLVRRIRSTRVASCLASSTQLMNSLLARDVMYFQESSAVGSAISASANLFEALGLPHRALAGCSYGHGNCQSKPVGREAWVFLTPDPAIQALGTLGMVQRFPIQPVSFDRGRYERDPAPQRQRSPTRSPP